MRNPCRMILLMLALVWLAGSAQSQSTPGKKIYGLGNLVTQKGVQKDLGLTKKQVDEIVKVAGAIVDKHKAELAKLPDLKGKERVKAETKVAKALTTETDTAVAKVLSPAQMTRLKQIQLQQRGPYAFTDNDVIVLMNYTKEQRKKILANELAYQKSLIEFGKLTNATDRSTKIQAAIKETTDKQLAVLTAEQKKTWQELIGKPYNR